MKHYLVFEKVQETQASGGAYAHYAPPQSTPIYTNLVTLVEAESPDNAVKLVIGATKRVGQYAVVEAEHVSFLPNETALSEEGILKAKPKEQKELTNGD